MPAALSSRLESVFGVRIDQVEVDHILGLVTNGVSEEFDLDFKRDLYGRSDSAKRELAGDVAALANTAGGVILIGVDEDDHARASAAPGVDVSDDERARMLQVVAAGVAPMPPLDIRAIIGPGSKSPGYFIIMVSRSTRAPHAVIVNDGYRFPVRNGATTRYLTEPEIAAAYRARHAGEVERDERLNVVDLEAMNKLNQAQGPWLVVSLVPDLPGAFDVTSAAHQEFSERHQSKDAGMFLRMGVSYHRIRTGRRRLIADGGVRGEDKATYCLLECHSDGCAVAAVEVLDWNARREPDTDGNPQLVLDEAVVAGVLTGLLRTAQHAVRTGAGGNAVVRASVVPTNGHAYEIGHNRGFGFGDSRSSAPLGSVAIAETVVALSEASVEGPELVQSAAMLVDELGQSFGFPEMGQISRDGQIRIRYWGRTWADAIKGWADRCDVTVTTETL